MAANGRPRAAESERRRIEFLHLVFEGIDCAEAARLAKVKPERALAILAPFVLAALANQEAA